MSSSSSGLKQQNLSSLFDRGKASKSANSTASTSVEQAGSHNTMPTYPGHTGPGVIDREWIHNLRLANPGNHCYANAAVCALMSVFELYQAVPPGLRSLHRACWLASAGSQALTLKRQFAMRSCVPNWSFSDAQQDAVEFTGQLLEGIGWLHGRWEARSFQDGRVQS